MTERIPTILSRLWARSIDQIVEVIILWPVLVAVFQSIDEDGLMVVHWSAAVLIFIVPLAYEWFCYYFWSATLGKYLLGLKVESRRHLSGDLTFTQSLLRALGFRLEFFFSLAPLVLAFSRYDRTHLVDWIAETRVVRETPGAPRRIKVYSFITWVFFILFLIQGLSRGFILMQSYEIDSGLFYLFLDL